MEKIHQLINSYQKEIIQSLQECISIKSISGDQEGIDKVLEFFLGLAQKMGFQTSKYESLGGLIEHGSGEKTIGIIGHLDTVPEGSGWSLPPFSGEIRDGKIYGRGAIDNKGPSLAALYALKIVQDLGLRLRCKINMILGVDEETVWTSTFKLLHKIREPDFSFVPDSKFPIVIAEKGLIWLELRKEFPPNDQKNSSKIAVLKMAGQEASLNIVPDYCEAVLALPPAGANTITENLKNFLQKNKTFRIECQVSANRCRLHSYGQSAHAFACNEGQNAISQLILFLSQLDLSSRQKEFLQTYSAKIGMEFYGESLGLQMEDKLTGKLTVNPGYIYLDENSAVLKCDIRFPASQELNIVKTKVESAFRPFHSQVKFIDSLKPLNFPEDDPHITKLLKVYREYTGDKEAKPLGMGGTTFAKAFSRAVAFGPTFPDMAKVEHQPDEYMEIEHLLRCTEIYALALQELCT